jgi:hypothetical protein
MASHDAEKGASYKHNQPHHANIITPVPPIMPNDFYGRSNLSYYIPTAL